MSNIILGIPGAWKDQREIVQSIARTGAFLFAGQILLEIASGKSCAVEIYEHDPQLESAFRIAAQGRISDEELAAIAQHHQTVYLLSDGASSDTARDMMRFANGLFQSGGLGVKVESSGVAHSKERWAGLVPSEPFDLLCAFVTLVGGDSFYSCGMHNLALPDCEMPPVLSPTEAATIINNFNLYQLAQSPVLEEGHTFSLDKNGPIFRLLKRPDEKFSPDDPFHNPHGIWHLSLV